MSRIRRNRPIDYWQLWVNPLTGQLEAAIPLSRIKPNGSFGVPQLYLIQGRVFIRDYSGWDFWAECGDF